MAKHSLRIDYDDETDKAAIQHRCTINVAGIDVSYSEPVESDGDLGPALKAFVDVNREAIERTATGLAINHVSAVNDVPQPGIQRLKIGGGLTALGAAKGKVQ